MSKTLGWAIKLIAWFCIFVGFSVVYEGDIPMGIYILILVLCGLVEIVVKSLVKSDLEGE